MKPIKKRKSNNPNGRPRLEEPTVVLFARVKPETKAEIMRRAGGARRIGSFLDSVFCTPSG
jgi:hypothetical protein